MKEHTLDEHRRELHRKILSDKENSLHIPELDAESNYNQIDGIIGNAPARGADLTDGQTYEEMRELAPETLPEEKQSDLDHSHSEEKEQEKKDVFLKMQRAGRIHNRQSNNNSRSTSKPSILDELWRTKQRNKQKFLEAVLTQPNKSRKADHEL